jgi:hypothetical protein
LFGYPRGSSTTGNADMNKISVIAIAAAAFCSAAVAGPFDQFKGKVKPGLYEYKVDMQMAGMPQGMGSHSTTVQHCVTEKSVEDGDFTKRDKQAKDCEIQDMKVSGNTAHFKTVCTGQNKMTADTTITFRDNGFVSDMKMAMDQGRNGQPMTMTQHMESRRVGDCK